MTGAADFKLRIRGLRKTYGRVVALDNADIEMREGEFLTLLGPSGSGKTTMLMAIAGLNEPDAGEVWLDGKLATYLPSFKRDIGMVFQNYALFPHMTIFENIAFPLRMRKLAEDEIRASVERVLDIVQLPDVAERLPKQLSGGQQQRIALARAFVYEPSIILMDEPLGALDKKLRDQLQLEIKHLHHRLGITVLYVTHDQEEAMVMSDRICLMNDAKIEQIGTPDELYFRPASLFAADFLGESNFIKATVVEVRDNGDVLADASGNSLIGMTNATIAKGQSVSLMMRPECLRLLGEGETADNTAEGLLKEIIMSGHITRYFVELTDGTPVVSTQLTLGPIAGLKTGGPVRIGWPKDRTVALPDSVALPHSASPGS